MSYKVNEYSSQKVYSTHHQQQETPNLKTLIFNVNLRINKLEHTYTNPKDKYEIGQITSEVMAKISDAKKGIEKTNGLSSKFFKVRSEVVMKTLEEIQGILDSSPAGQLHALQQILDGADYKLMHEQLDQQETYLKTEMVFPQALTQMKSDLLSYLHENDFDLVGTNLSLNDEYEFNKFIPYNSCSYTTLRRAISQYCHHVEQGKLDKIVPQEFEKLQKLLGETQENINKTLSQENKQAASELNQSLLQANKKLKEDIQKNMAPDMIFLRDIHQKDKEIKKTSLIFGREGFSITDGGFSIVIDPNNQLKINRVPASQHGGKLLDAAKKFVYMIRRVDQMPDESFELLALKAARQEFLLASKAERALKT